ncbi:MAG: carboxypeptidase-like regulatory domain-containing protein, partial [Sphingobacteriales bacterium]
MAALLFMRYLLLVLLLLGPVSLRAQLYYGRVTDAVSRDGLPFATIRIGQGKEGLVTDLNGYFRIPSSRALESLQISYLGYETFRVNQPKPGDSLLIRLSPSVNALNEVVFSPPYDKIRRILNRTIANRDKHNPDKYDWYRCHVYYKMLADIRLPDSAVERLSVDTSSDARSQYMFLSSQHVLLSETYSIRTWQKPERLQEDVLASRLSGFRKSLFTNLITDILPFHCYTDYITLNAKDYHNPVSKGYSQRYDFNLNDEVIQGTDTLWILSFRPSNATVAGLKGTVYINSKDFAIAYFLATAKDENLKRTVRLEQQYQEVKGKWFPRQLNYILELERKESRVNMENGQDEDYNYTIILKGNSQIDSVSWERDPGFRFDRAHTVRLKEGADERHDSTWLTLRPDTLNHKEKRTYHFTDSIMEVVKIEKYLPYLEKLVEGKVPIGPLDLDLRRLYSYNRYEHSRFGLGLQTNERISKRLSAGGWAGYGMKDKEWKYGGFIEAYGDRYKDFTLRAAYEKDLSDPGRIRLHPELDRTYLRRFLMFRVDETEAWTVEIKKRFGYWTLDLGGRKEKILPRYDYAFEQENSIYTGYEATELTFGVRFAFAERRAPLFGKYYSTGTNYPVVYTRLTAGSLKTSVETPYLKALTAVSWNKHINRVGNERFLILAGKTWSKSPLPLSKLFAGNGFRYDQGAVYAFGGMMTLYPYDLYSDQFVNFYWKHEFDWRFYKTDFSAPSLSLAHNILYGTLEQPAVHKLVSFRVPDAGYHESGILLNN